jgi:hypothetical protein
MAIRALVVTLQARGSNAADVLRETEVSECESTPTTKRRFTPEVRRAIRRIRNRVLWERVMAGLLGVAISIGATALGVTQLGLFHPQVVPDESLSPCSTA